MADILVIGKPVDRIDGRRKVTGQANYAADNRPDGRVHGYGVMSTIASGEITGLDARAAERAPGVLAVFYPGKFPKLTPCPEDMANSLKAGETRPPFADKKIYYAGQYVALVVAETFEQARWAAHLVTVSYRETPPALTLDEGIQAHGAQPHEDEDGERGDPDGAFAKAAIRLDATYTTPVEVHHAMEAHATVAEWNDDRLTLHDSTQWVVGQQKSLAKVLGIDPEKVIVHAPFIGSGFGSKLFLWPQAVLAAVAARELQRPVKVELTRKDQFTTAGHRPATRQRIRLGATPSGELVAVRHDTHSHTSLIDAYVESCGESTLSLYRCPNLAATHRTVQVNVGTPTSMRAPGSASGLFALESAMDELAIQLRMDPIELRLRNAPPRDGNKDLPWSSSHFEECLRTAADRFGWARRDPAVGAMRDGREILGWGVAAATWPAHRKEAQAKVELLGNGTARVSCATQDIGTGTYTVIAQVVSELTTLPLDKIEVVIGRSNLPPGPISGGSMATATVVPAIAGATREAIKNLFAAITAPGGIFAGQGPDSLSLVDGQVVSRPGNRREPLAAVLGTTGPGQVSGEAHAKPGDEAKKYSFRAFGVHCVEVRWDPGISHLRVSRITGVFDTGRIINHKTARNQVHGSMVMGLGMALLEQSVYDPRTGRVVTDNLADYLVPVHADTPQLDVTFLDRPDPVIGDFGAKGLGEIGITGVAAAIANAIYHATGKRVRDLPITVEKLLG